MKKLLLLVGLMCIASDAGTASVASAAGPTWRIRIDNRGDPDAPLFWGTDDDIIVRACGNRWGWPCEVTKVLEGPTGIRNSFDIEVSENDLPLASLGEIHVSATGNDLFVIDQIRIYDANGVERRKFGLDDMQGYCVSLQASDVHNPPCGKAGGPICWWNFKMSNGAVTGQCP